METGEQENINFLERVDHVEIAASTKIQVNLSTIYNKYGRNFNTLTIINTSDYDIEVYCDNKNIQYVLSGNSVFSFDNEFGLKYSDLAIENTNGANAITANQIKISVGRTGIKKEVL